MARKLRIEYAGAIYHVMNREDRGGGNIKDDQDRQQFLATMVEACQKTAWQMAFYVVKGASSGGICPLVCHRGKRNQPTVGLSIGIVISRFVPSPFRGGPIGEPRIVHHSPREIFHHGVAIYELNRTQKFAALRDGRE